MEIGAMEGCPPPDAEKIRDILNNACFTYHKSGCRPWKQGKEPLKYSANNPLINSAFKDPQQRESKDDN